MRDALKAMIVGAVGAGILLVAVQSGVISFGFPDSWGINLPSLPRDVVEIDRVIEPEEPAVVTRVEPVSLDCRARLNVTVAVEGRRDHQVAGVTYRTDTVSLDAIGDVDTCVDGDAVTITPNGDGSFVVDVPGEAITFVRPRVDTVATAQSVEYDKGFAGELTDLVPGVDDGDDLIAGAYAYAQQEIGGRACMQTAFTVTSQALEQAYADQLTAQGVDPSMVTVEIGEPDFDQHRPLEEIEGFEFRVSDAGVQCTLSPDAYGGVSPDWRDLTDQS